MKITLAVYDKWTNALVTDEDGMIIDHDLKKSNTGKTSYDIYLKLHTYDNTLF